MEEKLISALSDKVSALFDNLEELDKEVHTAHSMKGAQKMADYYHDAVLARMEKVREIADYMEVYTAKEYWPFPTYGDLLFSIQE